MRILIAACSGFLLILLVESIVHKFFGGHGHGHGDSDAVEDIKEDYYQEEMRVKIPRVTSSHHVHDNEAFQEESFTKQEKEPAQSGPAASPHFTKNVSVCTMSSNTLCTMSSNTLASGSSTTDSIYVQPHKTDSKASQRKDTVKLLSSLRGFLVVVALSVHSLFEGMAVGLEETSGGVWQLFLAIAIHSTAIVFCIGTGRP